MGLLAQAENTVNRVFQHQRVTERSLLSFDTEMSPTGSCSDCWPCTVLLSVGGHGVWEAGAQLPEVDHCGRAFEGFTQPDFML